MFGSPARNLSAPWATDVGIKSPTLEPGRWLPSARLPGYPTEIEIGAPHNGNVRLILFERGHWCVACRKHLSQVSAAMGEFEQRSVEVLAVVHESLDQLRTAQLASELAFPVGVDADLAISEAIEIVGIDEFGMRTIRPTAILLWPNGEIAFSYVGDDSIDRLTVPALLLAVDRFA